MNHLHLDRLNDYVRKTVLPFCERMVSLYGENLRSISLYGSGVGEDFLPGRSNINLLIVMEKIDEAILKKGLKSVSWGKRRRLVPLFLTLDHMNSSLDTFPLEFLEMKDNHINIYGDDILAGLQIDSRNLRLQCEQQLKGGLIKLQQVYLESGANRRMVRSLVVNSFTSFIPVFRGLLRLKRKELPSKRTEIIAEMAKEFSLREDVFLKVLRLKEGKKVEDNLEKIFGDYLQEIQKLCQISDRIEIA